MVSLSHHLGSITHRLSLELIGIYRAPRFPIHRSPSQGTKVVLRRRIILASIENPELAPFLLNSFHILLPKLRTGLFGSQFYVNVNATPYLLLDLLMQAKKIVVSLQSGSWLDLKASHIQRHHYLQMIALDVIYC